MRQAAGRRLPGREGERGPSNFSFSGPVNGHMAHTGGDVCASDRAASYCLFLFGLSPHLPQPGIVPAMLAARPDCAIVRVEGISRFLVATFRRGPMRAIRHIDTAALFGRAASLGSG